MINKLFSPLALFLLFFLNVSQAQDMFEPNNTINNPATINCGTVFQPTIHVNGDVDWYEVQLQEPGVLSISITFIPGNLDLNLGVYQIVNGQPVLISDDNESNSVGGQSLTSTAYVEAGTYLFFIEDEFSNGASLEAFFVNVTCYPNLFEINQTIELAKPIARDTCFEDNIWGENNTYSNSNDGNQDQDWFKVTINEPGKLKAALTSTPGNIDLNLEIFILDDNGLPKIISDDDENNSIGGQSLTSVAYIDPGIYYIHIEDENNNSTTSETYTFCLEFFPNPTEINQTIDLAYEIPLDTCLENNIWGENNCYFNSNDGNRDQDWFVVNVSESGKLRAALSSVPANVDLTLEILFINNNGIPIILADDDENNAIGGQSLSSVAFINPGTYYIHIEDENNNSGNQETYTFCLQFYPNPTEINQTINLAYPIALDTCFENNVWGENALFFTSEDGDNDQDWFQVEFVSLCTLSLSITDIPTTLDLNLELFQITNNQEVLIDDDGDSNTIGGQNIGLERIVEPGVYYIHIEDENNNSTSSETYNFCISGCGLLQTSVNSLQIADIQLFPNPVNQTLHILGQSENAEVFIYSLDGKLVFATGMKGVQQIDVSELHNGVYILRIKDQNSVISKKIIKQGL